jgi:hypothetical protein
MREKILSAKTKKRIVEFPEKNDDRLVKSGKKSAKKKLFYRVF